LCAPWVSAANESSQMSLIGIVDRGALIINRVPALLRRAVFVGCPDERRILQGETIFCPAVSPLLSCTAVATPNEFMRFEEKPHARQRAAQLPARRTTRGCLDHRPVGRGTAGRPPGGAGLRKAKPVSCPELVLRRHMHLGFVTRPSYNRSTRWCRIDGPS
jgi:hypothetical protein